MSLDAVRNLLADALDANDLDGAIRGLAALSPQTLRSAINAGLILSDFSKKAAVAYFQAVPDLLQVLSPDAPDLLEVWVGMGIQIAEHSAATGIKFFRQGPAVFSHIPDLALQRRFMAQGIALARQDTQLAFEYYQQAPALLSAVALSPEAFSQWVGQGIAMGRQDYTLAVEYFRIGPALLRALPIDLLPRWVSLAQGIQPLYTALLFIRNSPEVLARIGAILPSSPTPERLLEPLLDLLDMIVPRHPDVAYAVFASAADVLMAFSAHHLDGALLARAMRIAQFDAEMAATLFQHGREVLTALGAASSHFAAWVDAGVALLARDPIAARSYFALASKSARTEIDRLRGGVSLSGVARTLQAFAQALCGQPVAIAPCAAGESDAPTTDGRTIYLPAHVGYFPDAARNREWYTVATAFQAGFLEFGSFSIEDFLAPFSEPALAGELFEVAEGARVAFRLQQSYPGLRAALVRMREADLAACREWVGLTPRGVVVEILRQISLAGKTREAIPAALQSLIFDACQILGAVQSLEATVATSINAVARVYDLLHDEGDLPRPSGEMEPLEDRGPQRRGEGEGGGEMRPSTRGHLDPERVAKTTAALKEKLQAEGLLKKLQASGLDQVGTGFASVPDADAHAVQVAREGVGSDAPPELDEGSDDRAKHHAVRGTEHPAVRSTAVRRARYDEWDAQAEDYRPDWCQVIARGVPEGDGNTVTVSNHRARAILVAFERLRPVGFARVRGAPEGDAFDLERLVEARVAARMRQSPSDRVYIQYQRKERDVAAAFLVDLSGSTQRQVADGGRTVLQVEKEALVLLSRALFTLGDRFALFGFSGRGREAVDFQVVKSFEEGYDAGIDRRIAHLQAAGQNRDGAAIRHATRMLAAEPARIKTLFLISDGRPLDDAYEGLYAMADTKMALREAKRIGIHPFCITVDRNGEDDVRGMYGDVAYLVIDRIETLPIQLPIIYKRLTT